MFSFKRLSEANAIISPPTDKSSPSKVKSAAGVPITPAEPPLKYIAFTGPPGSKSKSLPLTAKFTPPPTITSLPSEYTLPLALISPCTVNVWGGVVVPIPTLPESSILILSEETVSSFWFIGAVPKTKSPPLSPVVWSSAA